MGLDIAVSTKAKRKHVSNTEIAIGLLQASTLRKCSQIKDKMKQKTYPREAIRVTDMLLERIIDQAMKINDRVQPQYVQETAMELQRISFLPSFYLLRESRRAATLTHVSQIEILLTKSSKPFDEAQEQEVKRIFKDSER